MVLSKLVIAGAILVIGLPIAGSVPAMAAAKISRPGQYEGYSPALYDGHELTSTYVRMRDGTRIAIDIIRPTQGGKVVEDPLPVLWMHTPYNRRRLDGPSAAQAYPSGPIDLVSHGYVVAVADFRGLYASFGRNRLFNFGNFLKPAWTDAYDITEWLARQPWSTGKIGMWGCSATGGSQQQAAATLPPSLKAIFPLSPGFDAYEFLHSGGVTTPIPYNPGTSAQRDALASPVDGPEGQALLAEAKAEHVDDPLDQQVGLPFRDSVSPELGKWWIDSSIYPYMAAIRRSGIAVYAGGNWDEAGTKANAALMFGNMEPGRRKLIIGPQQHCRWPDVAAQNGLTIQTEQLRFFDYWLKGIDNGVMAEPPVTYYTYNAPAGQEWQQARAWPLPNERRTEFYLADGGMTTHRPQAGMATTAMAPPPVVTPVTLQPDPHGLAFDSEPLDRATKVTGYPVVHLWIESDRPDTDATAQLLDVAPDGTTRTYQMVGRLRASRRALGRAPYDNFGLPFHTQLEHDSRPLTPGTPAKLEFALMPMSYIFPQGHRIRVALSFSYPQGKDGTVTVLTGGARASSITLPVIPAD